MLFSKKKKNHNFITNNERSKKKKRHLKHRQRERSKPPADFTDPFSSFFQKNAFAKSDYKIYLQNYNIHKY